MKILYPYRRIIWSGALSTALLGCGEATGPGISGSDPVLVAAATDDLVQRFLLDNAPLVSLFSVGQAVVAAGNPEASAAPAVVPHELLGSAFIWDPDLLRYVIDPESDEAPALGIRFALYRIDQSTDAPALPLTVVGWLEVVQVAAGSEFAISIVAGVESDTTLTYGLIGRTGNKLQAIGSFRASGESMRFAFVTDSDASRRYTTFDVGAGLLRIDYEREFLIAAQVTRTTTTFSDAETSSLTVHVTSLDRNNVLLAESGVSINGARVADITGSALDAQIAPSEGSVLSPEELEAFTRSAAAVNQILIVLTDLNRLGLLLL